MNTSLKVTNRSFLALAIPMTLAYISTPLLGLVDTAVIGQLHDAALLGGLAVGSVLFDVIGSFFYFLRAGTTGLAAQALGASNGNELRAVLGRALLLGLIGGIVVIFLQWPLLTFGLPLIGGTQAVQNAAATYFSIRAFSAPFVLANYSILGWYLGLGKAGIGLLIQTFLNVINMVLSIVLVLVFEWGIPGVAVATFIAEMATFGLGIFLIKRELAGTPFPTFSQIIIWEKLRPMLVLNRDIMIRSLVMLFAFGFFTSRSAAQGDVVLAANAVLQKFILVAAFFLDGTASAAEQVIGQAVGAKQRGAFRKALRLSVGWGFGLSFAAAFVLWFAGGAVIDLLTVNVEVRETARTYMFWAAITPLVGTLAFQMDGVFIGATWSSDMRNSVVVSTLLFLAAYYVLFPIYGNHGLWFALLVFFGVRGLSLSYLCYFRERQYFGKLQEI
ncbi:MATE family efflux transporter [Pseudovibrio sp. Tun.PSC04-5.I4]|uniref:MATE family efflux transporter n=1 Tax=Pseudovibrio sp. Tun.PSC04-5.I4 TaxID=1798213 RepID=UPI000881CFCA|nr:MATE family efflux transporter [Pseudovibrio sp. Tun.PSC04-5.I4]SDQ83754.1 multidrug resistance protein, MATE family [Pseudovibrio sp. Tun.PSC04-5.I4]